MTDRDKKRATFNGIMLLILVISVIAVLPGAGTSRTADSSAQSSQTSQCDQSRVFKGKRASANTRRNAHEGSR